MGKEYLERLFRLAGKVTVVTGGGGVLCGAMSRALARVGAKVAVLDLRPEAAQKVVEDTQAAGGKVVAVRCDVLDKASIEAAVQTVLESFGRVDILIKRAGGNKKQATTSLDLAFFDLPGNYSDTRSDGPVACNTGLRPMRVKLRSQGLSSSEFDLSASTQARAPFVLECKAFPTAD